MPNIIHGMSGVAPTALQVDSNGVLATALTGGALSATSQSADVFGSATVTALANVARITTSGRQFLNLDVAVTGAALTQFQILGRFSSGGLDQLLYSTSADYLTPKGPLQAVGSDLSTLAVGNSFLSLNFGAYESFLFKAAGTASTVTLTGSVL